MIAVRLTPNTLAAAFTLPPVRSRARSIARPFTAQDTVGHDAWDRVVAVAHFKNGSPLASVSFTFDRDGSIRQGGETRTFDLATTRMTSRAGNSYYYDRAGNLDSAVVGGTGWRYIYDALDRLIAVRQNGVTLARYAYDVLGRRIVKRVYSGANAGYLRMVYRGSAVAVEADSLGNLTLGYTSGLGVDNLVAIHRYSDATHNYVVQDALHSVRGLSRRDGTWIASWRYGIYGAVIDSVGAAPFALRYRWTGREFDVETGFYYFRARFYDPSAQRFVQEDPIGFAGGANLYSYGDGNPMNGRDPDGLRFSWEQYAVDPNKMNKLTNCWSDDCSGSWHRGEAWGGFGWVNLTRIEREANYARYQEEYRRRQGEGVFDDAVEAEDCGECVGRTEMLSPEEYGAVYSAIEDLKTELRATVPEANPYAVTRVSGLLAAGRVAVNNYLVTGGALMVAATAGNVLFINSHQMQYYMGEDDFDSGYRVAWILAHEAGHFFRWDAGLRDNDECRANIFAANATGLGINYVPNDYCG